MSDEELEKVSGGSLWQTNELCNLIAGKIGRKLYYDEIESFLKDNYGIEADINGDPYMMEMGTTNIYKFGGREISHAQALKMIEFVEDNLKK